MNCNSCMKNYSSAHHGKHNCNSSVAKQNEWERMYPVKTDNNTSGSYPAKTFAEQPPVDMPGYCPEQSDNLMPGYDMSEMIYGYMYTPGYLRSNIGNVMRVEFQVGSGVDERVGVLREVGANYIVLDALDCGSKMMCDLYAIKLVTTMTPSENKAMPGYFTNMQP